ncbi:MAG: putative integral rane protein, partial [Bryobacterales bacterium]|nr:putative integral rane protein [Bryobacterales bacterium]
MILLVISVLCWGSWASAYKAAGSKWRFELFHYDFAVGMVIAALIAGFTFGSLGWDGFSFIDDVRNAGKRQDLWAFLGGCVFNLGNMLMFGALSIAGMAVAFPVAMGTALLVVALWNHFAIPGGNPLLLAAGCTSLAVAVVAAALAYKTHSMNQLLLL